MKNIKGPKKYVLSISFANYLEDKSGMSKVIMSHQQVYNEAKISYVYLYSVKKNICHDKIMLFCKFRLIIDGEYIGVFQMSQLIKMFYLWQKVDNSLLLDIHIHHLLYTNIDLIDELLHACNDTPIKVYLHDYYYACKEHSLLRNGEFFCGGNGLDSKNCDGCHFYSQSVEIEKRVHRLFAKYIDRIFFISPSETTKTIFIRFHPEYYNRIVVIPHQIYTTYYRGNLDPISSDEKIRVAFLGMPRMHKGWRTWERLVNNFFDKKYSFTVFNSTNETYHRMEKVKIGFSKENLNAMTDSLRENKIHIVLLWSITPETYSYTCFEAFSANVYIITNRDSGNIADVVNKYHNGIVISEESDLLELFDDSDKLRVLVNKYRQSTMGGPGFLQENSEIVASTLKEYRNGQISYIPKMVNYPLLWILNKIL